jgi:putative transposase
MKEQWASAPARKLAPQEVRTFFISASTAARRNLFQAERMKELMMDVLLTNRQKGRFELHEFVIMREHLHLLLTPAPNESLERCVQYIKGGFSFRAKRELGFTGEIWNSGYNEHRVRDTEDYQNHVRYIHENPVKAGMVNQAVEYCYSSANASWHIDPAPDQFRG